MSVRKHRNNLPQLGDTRLLTYGGFETTAIFHEGLELPLFASIDVLRTEEGCQALQRCHEQVHPGRT